MNFRIQLSGLVIIGFITSSFCDIQPIDVEPVIRKEQPDFEDDIGVGIGDDSHGKDNDSRGSNESSEEKDQDLWTRLTSGSNLGFTHAFVASLTVIIVSELGDKTFFIAAIMAMTNPRLTVFGGAMAALTFMHVLAASFGYVITFIPRMYTFYASAALFVFFGLKMLREGCKMKPNEGQEEIEEIQMDLRKREGSVSLSHQEDRDRDDGMSPVESISTASVEDGGTRIGRLKERRFRFKKLIPKVFLEAFVLTFLAEWGDRSQIATVILATSNDVYGVIIGGLLGHSLCTGLAVIGGKLIATKISVRTVTIIGGVVFLIFAASAFIMGP